LTLKLIFLRVPDEQHRLRVYPATTGKQAQRIRVKQAGRIVWRALLRALSSRRLNFERYAV
jgi:hypothetical protein